MKKTRFMEEKILFALKQGSAGPPRGGKMASGFLRVTHTSLWNLFTDIVIYTLNGHIEFLCSNFRNAYEQLRGLLIVFLLAGLEFSSAHFFGLRWRRGASAAIEQI